MKKILAAVLLLVLSAIPALAQQSKAALNTEINTNWPNNTSGAITPALLRSTVSDIVASYVDWLTCTTQGGTLYWDATASPACLTAGTAGYILKSGGSAGNPSWQANTSALLTVSTNFRFIGNSAGAGKAAQELSASTLFDWLASTQGNLMYRSATAWTGLAPASLSGYVLQSGGSSANPSWGANNSSLITVATNFRFIGNSAGASQQAQELSANTLFDWIGATRGSIFMRDATGWAQLTPGTDGFVLTTKGVGANPLWTNPASGGTVTSITCGVGLTCTGSAPITTAGTITPDTASVAQIAAATAGKLVDSNVLSAGGQLATLAPASPTIAVDFSLGVNFALALTGSVQLGNPSDATPGRTGCIFITKDTTARTLSYNSSWKFAGGTAPVLSTTTTTVPDVLCYMVRTTTFVWGTMTKAIQ